MTVVKPKRIALTHRGLDITVEKQPDNDCWGWKVRYVQQLPGTAATEKDAIAAAKRCVDKLISKGEQ